MNDIIHALPERWRAAALAIIATLVALQMLASAVVALMPARYASHPLVAMLHRFGHMRFKDEPGTLKLPGSPVAGPPTPAARYEAERRAYMTDPDAPPPRATRPAPPPQSGRATVATLLLLAAVGLGVPAAVVCCGPRPPPADGTVVSSWTDTARTVLNTLSWAIPSARAILAAILPEPARSIVGRALDAVAVASTRLQVALEAYESRGGDRCAAHAAVGGVRAAVVELAQVLADHGVALGTALERVADSAASILDALIPSCSPDAGWASAGDRTNAELRAIAARATARGIVLRRDLDGVRP